MKIAIACDHAGYEYKEKLVAFLRQKGYEVKDFGTHSAESMDYPDTAHPMAAAVESGEFERGIALCGSGNGICMTVNNIRVSGVHSVGRPKSPGWHASITMPTYVVSLPVLSPSTMLRISSSVFCLPNLKAEDTREESRKFP